MMKCPYCFEKLREKAFNDLKLSNIALKCPYCSQFIIGDLVNVDFPSLDKKTCFFCGKKILKEARICRYCHRWLDEFEKTIRDLQ